MKRIFYTVLFVACAFLTAGLAQAASWDGTTLSGDGEFSDPIDNGAANIAISPTNGGMTVLGDTTTTGTVTHTASTQALYFGKNDGGVLSGGVNNWGEFQSRGTGQLQTYFAGSSVTNVGNFYLSYGATAHVFVQDDAEVNISGNFYLNQAAGAQAIITQTGGVVNVTTSTANAVRIGHWPNTNGTTENPTYPSRYTISSGELNILSTVMHVGWDGPGELNISGDAVVNVLGLKLASNGGDSSGKLNLTGGTLNIGAEGVFRNQAASYFNLGNGTIGALANHTWGSGLPNVVFTGNTTFNTNGYDINFACASSGTGGITKTGSGNLTITNAANTYSGGTVVEEGTLTLGEHSDGNGVIVGNLTIKEGAVVSTALNAFGWNTGRKINTVNITGGTLTHTTAGDLGWGVTYNLTGALMETTNSGGQFAFGNGTVVNALASDTASEIRGRVSLRDSTTFNVADGAAETDLLVSAVMMHTHTAGFGFTKTGAGTMTLTAANTFTGPVVVEEGTLVLAKAGNTAVGTLQGGIAVTVKKDGTLMLDAGDALGWEAGLPSLITVDGGVLTTSGNNTHYTMGNVELISGELGGWRQNNIDNGNVASKNYNFDGRIIVRADTDGSSRITAQHLNFRTAADSGYIQVDDGGSVIISSLLASDADTGKYIRKTGGGEITFSGGSTAHLTIMEGTAYVTDGTYTREFIVGDWAENNATAYLQGGSITGQTFVGKWGTGTLYIDGTNIDHATTTFYVGYSGTADGTVYHSAGDVSVYSLYMGGGDGVQVNTKGYYEMTGGSLTLANHIVLGYGGLANFVQDGGDVKITNQLYIADQVGSAGSGYTIKDGTLSASNMTIGQRDGGYVQQDGGEVTVTGTVTLGTANNDDAIGTYNLAGGVLNAGSVNVRDANGSKFEMTNGGTLQTKTFTGSLANSGGVLDLVNITGDGLNTMAISADYTQGSGAELFLEIHKNGIGDYEFDKLDIDGLVTLDGTLNLLLTGETWTVDDMESVNANPLQIFTPGFADILGDFATVISTSGMMGADMMWLFDAGTGTLSLGVPEPATWCLMLAGLAGLLWVRRRRG